MQDQPVPAVTPGAAADGTGHVSKAQYYQRFSASKRQRKARVLPAKPPASSASQPLPPTSVSRGENAKESELARDWNAVIGEDESCLPGNASVNQDTVVHAGTIVRVVSTFKVNRPSEFLHGSLNLDPHR